MSLFALYVNKKNAECGIPQKFFFLLHYSYTYDCVHKHRRGSGASVAGDDNNSPSPNLVNKGWNLLQDVFTSSTSLNTEGRGRTSR